MVESNADVRKLILTSKLSARPPRPPSSSLRPSSSPHLDFVVFKVNRQTEDTALSERVVELAFTLFLAVWPSLLLDDDDHQRRSRSTSPLVLPQGGSLGPAASQGCKLPFLPLAGFRLWREG